MTEPHNSLCSDWVELRWSVMGDRLSSDHNYRLYSSLIQQNPHLKDIDWQLNTINGIPDRNGWVKLCRDSILAVRCKYSDLKEFAVFDNSIIRIGQNLIELDSSDGQSLSPKEKLWSRLVTIKSEYVCRVSPFEFGVALGKQLKLLGIESHPALGDRKTTVIKDTTVVGYSIEFPSLKPQESLLLQSNGLGGRRKIGCGFFL